MNSVNLLLIGFGPHAKRIHYPICKREEEAHGLRIVFGVDLLEKREDIESYLQTRGESLPMYYVTDTGNTDSLDPETERKLNEVVNTYHIHGAIISTEPSAHVKYAAWALARGIHILMDKPISAVKHSSTSEEAVYKIIEDFENLKTLYKQSEKKYGRLLFSLMAQRRYHPAFQKIKWLISEVFEKTNCPITSVQSFHADGQWRLPSDIIDIRYHSYNDGYGVCSHSGYHSLDIISWWMKAAEAPDKEVNNIDVFSNIVRPGDFISQFTLQDYRKIFPDFDIHNTYDERAFRSATRMYGEIDAFNSFAFKHDTNIITLGSANLVHNSFSQRGWLLPKKDLYKGNGRLRQETHFIEQGPFQSISLVSYQSHELDIEKQKGMYDVGGEYHLDIQVFRNSNLFPEWKDYEKYSIKDLTTAHVVQGYSRGHQEDARRNAIIEFVDFIKGKDITPCSDFFHHEIGTKLLAGIYLSAARRFNNLNPLVNINLSEGIF